MLLARLDVLRGQMSAGAFASEGHDDEVKQIANALIPLMGQAKSINMDFFAFLIELAAMEALNEVADKDPLESNL